MLQAHARCVQEVGAAGAEPTAQLTDQLRTPGCREAVVILEAVVSS